MSDNRPIAYREGDLWVVRASSVGRSVRCLAAAMNGYDPLPAPEYLMKAAAAGDRYEEIVKGRLSDDGFILGTEQDEIILPVSESIIIRGHLDGESIISPGDPTDRMLEVKSMSNRVHDKWITHGFDRFPSYEWQIATYMHATGKPALYAIINRDTDELHHFIIDSPPVPLREIRQKVLLAVHYAEKGELPKCNVKPEYACPYDYLCDIDGPFFEEVESGSDSVIARLAEEYNQVRNLEAEVRDRKAAIRDELLTAMLNRERVQAGKWKVSVTNVDRTYFDKKKALRELGEDRVREFMSTSTSTQVRVKESS